MKKSRLPRFNFWAAVALIVVLFCLIFIVYPFFVIIKESVHTSGEVGLSFGNYLQFFQKNYYKQALGHSMLISIVVTITSVAVGLPLAYIGSRFKLYLKKIINGMIVLSMLSPPFIGAYAWITLLGRSGIITGWLKLIGIQIGSIYGFGGIVLVFTLKLFPIVYLYVTSALESIDVSLEEASENLGIGGLKRIFKITFPIVMPTILSAAMMVFMTALADYGTPRLIGQGYTTLPVVIYDEFMGEVGTDSGFASALSVIIIAISLLVLIIQKLVIDKKSYNMSALRPPEVIKLSSGKKALATFVVFFCAFLSVLPQITVVIQSFMLTKGPVFYPEFSLKNYAEAFTRVKAGIINTYIYAFIAIVIMIALGIVGAYLIVRKKGFVANLIDILLMFPYVIPGAVLGICLLTSFNSGAIILSGTMWIIIISYVIRKLPYTMRSSVGILYQIDVSLEEASLNLGVSQFMTFFKITVPLMLKGVISGAILSFIGVLNTLSATLVLYTGKTITLPVSIFACINNDSFGRASAMASVLTLTTIAFLLIFSKLSKGKVSVI